MLLLGVPLLMCGSCTVLGAVGMKLYSAEVCGHLASLGGVQEKVGAPLTGCSIDFGPTLAIDDNDTWVFDVKGSKGVGRVWVKSSTNDDGDEVFEGTLLLVDGKEELLEGVTPPKK